MKQDITTEPVDIRRIRKYYKQLYTHKFSNMDEMDHFIEKQTITTHPI